MAIRHNNVIPNVHLRKYWQRYVKTWFNQPARAARRATARKAKAKKVFPRPTHSLRSAVHPPTQRYNMKIRLGRGFTKEELAAVGLNKNTAKAVGITFDPRRKNKSEESFQLNVERLNEYISKLAVFNSKAKFLKLDASSVDKKSIVQNLTREVIPLPTPKYETGLTRAILAKEKETSAYQILVSERKHAKELGKRVKAAKEAEEKAKQAK